MRRVSAGGGSPEATAPPDKGGRRKKKRREKSFSFQVLWLRLLFPLSCVLLRFIPAPAAFYSNGILNVFSLKKQSTMCAVCKSIAEWSSERDKSLSKEPGREGGGGRGTKTTSSAATTASATQRWGDRVEEVEGKRLIGAPCLCPSFYSTSAAHATKIYTQADDRRGNAGELFFFFNEAAAMY